MSRFKAQAEFVAIIVFLVLVVVVVYTALVQPNTDTSIPDDVRREYESVKAYFVGVSKKVTGDFIKHLESTGGYPDSESQGGSLTFLGNTVPIWQRCENSFIPPIEDLEKELSENIEDYIRANGPEAAGVFKGEASFDFSRLNVTAKIRETRVDVSIYLPTRIDQHTIRESINFSYLSNLGSIYNFASDMSTSQGENRYFENFLLATIYLSKHENENPLLPTFDVFYKDGDIIQRSGELMTAQLADSINHTISSIMLWADMTDQSMGSYPKTYSIKNVEGRQYTDLNPPGASDGIEFLLPDDYTVNITDEFGWSCLGKFIETVECDRFKRDVCLASYNVDYNITFPVVVRVFDRPTGSYFSFAILSAIDNDMKPGGC